MLTVLAELGQVNIRRAYGNWAESRLKGWSKVLHLYGISPHQQFDLTKGKNATDMAMTIDAMDLLSQGKVDGFGIMSSDSDFTPLAMRLRQDGVLVYGFGRAKTPEAFKSACTRFIEVDALIENASKDEEPAPTKGRGRCLRRESGRGRDRCARRGVEGRQARRPGSASLSGNGQDRQQPLELRRADLRLQAACRI